MVQVGNPVGNLAAIGMFALVSQLPESEFMAWGWRIPFLISVLLVGVGLWIRLRMEETPAFRQIKARNEVAKMPVLDIFKYHRRPFFTAVCLKISEIAYASIAGVFVMSYATSRLGLSRGLILNGVRLSGRGSWTLTLTGGAQILLGDEHVDEHLQRFLAVLPRVGADHTGGFQRADLRYSNGFAILWANNPAPIAPGAEKHT